MWTGFFPYYKESCKIRFFLLLRLLKEMLSEIYAIHVDRKLAALVREFQTYDIRLFEFSVFYWLFSGFLTGCMFLGYISPYQHLAKTYLAVGARTPRWAPPWLIDWPAFPPRGRGWGAVPPVAAGEEHVRGAPAPSVHRWSMSNAIRVYWFRLCQMTSLLAFAISIYLIYLYCYSQ